MPKAKAAPSLLVKVAVCVMKPGPMAEVAMRKMAAVSEARRDLATVPAWLAANSVIVFSACLDPPLADVSAASWIAFQKCQYC